MKPVTLILREQMRLMKPILTNKNVLSAARVAQDKIGSLGARSNSDKISFEDINLGAFPATWAHPTDRAESKKVIMYLHGGGYTAGGLEYARGFGSMLACATGRRVLCPAYRLAPENIFPCALEDALCAYRYLLLNVKSSSDICLVGESAGGGLEYCLIHKLKELGLPLPAAVVAISPWVDLSDSGASHICNATRDPGLSKELLDFYADCYMGDRDRKQPLASPLYGDLSGFPPSYIVASQDEVLLSDSESMAKRLADAKSPVKLVVFPGMWHAFVLYGVPEAQKALSYISEFIGGF